MKSFLTVLVFLLLLVNSVFSQIDVQINSDDPRIPFPQFLDYSHGKTLGRDNATGVTDIEMERDIREAYQIMMNRSVYTGEEVAGTKYIVFNPPGHGFTGPKPDVTEGDGYALLAMAYMADKPAFDGLFMYVHDHKASVVEYFSNCGVIRNPDYEYGPGTIGWELGQDDAAADGDFDIAMAALVAYYQWPDQGITDDCGKVRLYKDLAIDLLKTISDTVFLDINNGVTQKDLVNCNPGSDGWYSGNIGFDGYVKSGNTWAEVTQLGKGYQWNGHTFCPRSNGEASKHIDYHAPSYFHAFYDFLLEEDSTQYAWNIHQFKRAEASSDWLMGKVYEKGYYPTAGNFQLSGSNVQFSEMNFAEDSRHPWRTILNYTWNGNPNTSWNETALEVVPGENPYEYNNAMRLAEFADNLATDICIKLGNDPTELKFGGVASLGQDINYSSGMMQTGVGFHINYNLGSFAPSIVAYHHEHNDKNSKDLLADWYRQLVLMWDATNEGNPYPESRYITSLPKYFHGWFRVLGLLITTGNYQSPEFMGSDLPANVKIYHDVDKTLAFGPTYSNGRLMVKGDVINETFSVRNFSSVEAQNVKVVYPLPEQVEFLSASNGGTISGTNVVWEIGNIPGYTSTGETGDNWESFDPTQYPTFREFTLKTRVKKGYETTRMCNQATVIVDNSSSHTSNEFPNNYTTTMERNCVDIRERSLEIAQKADKSVLKNGDVAEFTISFKNSSEGGWLNGGRPGTRVTYAWGMPGPNSYTNYFRLLHGAQEAYINPGNYRISYYVNDAARIGIFNNPNNPNGWDLLDMIQGEGGPMTFDSEEYTFGEDEFGKWNQRLIMRFPDTIVGTTQHTNMFFSKDGEPNDVLFVHKGIGSPFRKAIKMEAIGAPGSGCGSIPFDDLLTDDWSYPGDAYDIGTNDKSLYYPISPSWFDYESTYDESLNEVITNYHPDACEPIVTLTYDRLLVEEFDGYVWRRVMGNGPVPGMELSQVCVSDTLPEGLEWQGFTNAKTLGVEATYDPITRVISWCVSTMLPGAIGSISYRASATTDCSKNILVKNRAWIGSSSSSAIDSTVELIITCKDIPPKLNLSSSMYKITDRDSTDINETIKYDIAFKQSDGTIVAPDLSTTNGWEVECGNNMIDFSDSRNGNTSPTLVTYDFSHGTNGELWAQVAPRLSGGFSFVFRHKRGSGSPNCGGYEGLVLGFSTNSCAQASVDLYENGTLIESLSNLAYAAPQDTMTIKVKLEGDRILFWINNENALPYVIDGITHIEPGYVGFFSGLADGTTNETQKLLSWKTHFDSGFQVELKDLLPNEITVDQSSIIVTENTKGTGGTYTKIPVYSSGTPNEITWELVSDKEPMLYGDSVVFSFEANIDNCGIGSITNTATADMLGQPQYFIGDQTVTPCGAPEPCPLQSVDILPSPVLTIPEGGSGTLKSELVSNDAGLGYKYIWMRDGISDAGMSGGDLTDLLVENEGNYTLRIQDLLDPSCFVESDITVVTSGDVLCTPPTALSFTGDSVVCEGLDIQLAPTATGTATLDEYYYTWLDKTGSVVSGPSTTITDLELTGITAADTGLYTLRVEDGDNDDVLCYLEKSILVGINTIPFNLQLTSIVDTAVCPSQNITVEVTADSAATYEWTVDGTVDAETTSSITIPSGDGTQNRIPISVKAINDCGETTVIDTAFYVKPTCDVCTPPTNAEILTVEDTLCSGSTLTLEANIEAGYEYTWVDITTGSPVILNGGGTGQVVDDIDQDITTGGIFAVYITKQAIQPILLV